MKYCGDFKSSASLSHATKWLSLLVKQAKEDHGKHCRIHISGGITNASL